MESTYYYYYYYYYYCGRQFILTHRMFAENPLNKSLYIQYRYLTRIRDKQTTKREKALAMVTWLSYTYGTDYSDLQTAIVNIICARDNLIQVQYPLRAYQYHHQTPILDDGFTYLFEDNIIIDDDRTIMKLFPQI